MGEKGVPNGSPGEECGGHGAQERVLALLCFQPILQASQGTGQGSGIKPSPWDATRQK